MTHEEMIAMAREAGLGEHTNYEREQIWELKNVEALKRFKALVSAAERERCAKVCEDMQRKKNDLFDGKWKTSGTTEIDGSNFAAAIRKGK